MKAISSLGRQGRVVIPKAIRERLGLEAGDQLEFQVDGDRLSLRVLPAGSGCLREKDGLLVLTCRVEEDADHRSVRESRIRRLAGTR